MPTASLQFAHIPRGLLQSEGVGGFAEAPVFGPPLARTAGCGDLATSDRSGTNSSTSSDPEVSTYLP